jgi:hypothetical protein
MWQLIPFAVGQYLGYKENQKIGEEGEALAAGGEADYDVSINRLTNIANDVGLSQQSYKQRDTHYQIAEELSKAGVADADEIASQMMAGIGDSREEMAAIGKVKDIMKGKRDARLEGALMKLQGEAGLTKRAEALEDTKRGMEFNIADTRERDLARINTGMDAYFGSKAAAAEQFAAAGTTLSSSLIAASGTPDQRAMSRAQRQGGGGGGGGGDNVDSPNYGAMRLKSAFQNAPADIRPGTVDMSGAEGFMQGESYNLGEMFGAPNPEYGYGAPFGGYPMEDLGDVDDFTNQSQLGLGQYYRKEKGGYIAEGGGVTEGEFSHDTNKKAIIDEENGQKEGELTGGEIVFNPEQTDKIEDFVEGRDAQGLLNYMSMLFSLPQFQEA